LITGHTRNRAAHVSRELLCHLPYTAISAAAGMLALATAFPGAAQGSGAERLFHVFHPLHLFLSATATTATFWRHERHVLKAAAVGFTGAVALCGLSDAIIPYLGGTALGAGMEMHLCIVRHPLVAMPSCVAGIPLGVLLAGRGLRSSALSHGAHVLVSTMASLLYLASFGLESWAPVWPGVLLVVVLAVLFPCCLSDVVFPLLWVRSDAQEEVRQPAKDEIGGDGRFTS